MPIHNADIAAIFEEMADLLEIENSNNVFRVRAYRNASRYLQEMGKDVRIMVQRGEDLTIIPGIGEDLANKIQEIVETGHCSVLDKLHKQLPSTITELLKIPGLGPKRVKTLYQELDIHTMEQLQRAVRDHRIQSLAGFGEKTEMRIADALAIYAGSTSRFKLATAAQYAEPLIAWLRTISGVQQAIIAGSYRRAKETVGDIDILITAAQKSPVMTSFCSYDDITEVLSHGPTRSSVILKCKLQVDARVVEHESYGAALHYFTGSKAHNIAIRRLGQEQGLKINEYGVFKGQRRIAGETEESVYQSVGLPFIPPELREDRGEIEAARSGHLPELIELGDLKGDLHAHSKASDGHATLKEMASAAQQCGFEYLAITEHSRQLTVAHGLDPTQLAKQIDEIDRLNEQLTEITLLKGIEVDILEDGSLDLPDSILARLDLVVGAVHSRFELSRAKQTERILKAMDHPHFTLLAHPSGRLIARRKPYDVDMLRIIRKAKERGCYLELNAHPERLDLLDIYCQAAKDEGVLISINSDAHSVLDFHNLRFGIGQARRGWLEKQNVLNTRSLQELKPLLKRTM
ncbi:MULTISPECIES: DNA polymerase/3'-5' exonuclease PolX [Nitrosomonas]|uniref:DNA polymerase beta n=1 Tax=Nitrosomonas communis TaxID=44574 RepID=A0A0F7KGX2_9PROT|nr:MULTISPECIES: DNA polymerase/3'-5' exonuclease PolX [Nitrosomonas]AKH38082.1 DNA polymerase III [Nitrosomonas communis]TYP88174.1 DNA polymerase (family 10) [Nitrosomonas communis]UVS59982.1 DNA polymerase/3'-5' exonuclease PolX [Nitrosomonas sp. PLL12]